MKFIYRLSMC